MFYACQEPIIIDEIQEGIQFRSRERFLNFTKKNQLINKKNCHQYTKSAFSLLSHLLS